MKNKFRVNYRKILEQRGAERAQEIDYPENKALTEVQVRNLKALAAWRDKMYLLHVAGDVDINTVQNLVPVREQLK